MRPLESLRSGMWLFLLTAVLVSQPGRGFRSDLSFTGGLEPVGDKSISVKLPDGRVIDAMLPNTPALDAPAIAAQYRVGEKWKSNASQSSRFGKRLR
jgi:hypothetical protein